MPNKSYPLRNKGREFYLCTCSHDKGQHSFSWIGNKSLCQTCECPKYERNPDTMGFYEECVESDAEVSTTRTWSGCKTFYRKIK